MIQIMILQNYKRNCWCDIQSQHTPILTGTSHLCKRKKSGISMNPIMKKSKNGVSSCDTSGIMCLFCKMTKVCKKHGHQTSHSSGDPILGLNDVFPGNKISVDQYYSAVEGGLQHTKGKEAIKHKYTGGTIMVDHTLSKIFLRDQVYLCVGGTL